MTDQRRVFDVVTALPHPFPNASLEDGQRLAAVRGDLAPAGEPCFVAHGIGALDLFPAAILPFAEVHLRQAVVHAHVGLEEPGKLAGHFAAAPQRARPDDPGRTPREGAPKAARARTRILARRQVEPSVTTVSNRDRSVACAEQQAHRTPPPRQSASVSSSAHSTTCSVAPRKSPVSPPARRMKRTPHTTAVRPATASRPTSSLQSRIPARPTAPKSRAIQPLATVTWAAPAPTTPLVLAPPGETEGKIAIIHTGGSRASACVSKRASGANPASAARSATRSRSAMQSAAAPKLPIRLSRRITNSFSR